jgi:hypothetical protein
MIASLFGSTLMAAAQTGEFAVQVPGPVVHDAWEIQDQLQDARSGKRVNRSAPTDGNSNSRFRPDTRIRLPVLEAVRPVPRVHKRGCGYALPSGLPMMNPLNEHGPIRGLGVLKERSRAGQAF